MHSKKQNKQKRADISVTTLITVIILVISFVIILFLWYQFFWEGNIDRETCHTSVILKKTIPDKPIAIAGGKFVDLPLRCKTEKICLTSGINDKGCENIGTKYQKISVSSEEDIIKIVAENMASCWGMMGESRDAAIFSRELTASDSKGVICSIIDFSPNVQNEIRTLSSIKFNDYLAKTKIPDGIKTYIQYLSNSENPTSASGKMDVSLVLDKPFTIVFIEFRQGALTPLIGAGGGALLVGALFVSAAPVIGTAAAITTGIIAVGVGGNAAGEAIDKWTSLLSGNKEGFYSSLLLRYYKVQELKALNIDSFENLA